MKSKEYYQKLNIKFMSYWKIKRENKLKYVIKSTCFFAIPLSLVLGVSIFGTKELLSTKNQILTLTTFIVYGLYVFFIEYRINEKRYQKLLKEQQNFDQ
ncbi:hypothetical protein [Polaribacter porphyrae]|uniref:Uncharacterized protein n=1 Tax=Polaribacter porphyrae TaxID=1137780 RepID=A0A2S7WMQ2_9FLAO|nr:hypothetical protein [Polaribacter porphyrae]PQJ78895.1 hypothetical protein BTO18_06730 [Polaribacter porphyrae]